MRIVVTGVCLWKFSLLSMSDWTDGGPEGSMSIAFRIPTSYTTNSKEQATVRDRTTDKYKP